MKQFNPEQVRKIWHRVQSGAAYEPNTLPASTENTGMSLPELIARQIMEKGNFMQLSGRFTGKNAVILRQLAQQAQSHAAILRGICTMTEGNPPVIRPPKPAAAPTKALLQRCYGQSLQSLSEYELRASDPNFGSTFQTLAKQKQNHCHVLLALIGSLHSGNTNRKNR